MHDGVRVVCPKASKSLHNQKIKLQAGINPGFQMLTEAGVLASNILSKCGAF